MQKFLSVKVVRIALLLPIKRRTAFTSLKVVIDNPHGETGDKMLIFLILYPKKRYKFAISAIKIYHYTAHYCVLTTQDAIEGTRSTQNGINYKDWIPLPHAVMLLLYTMAKHTMDNVTNLIICSHV